MARVGVVGAGTMGNGIAHVFATAGVDVRLVDVDEAALDRARATIEKNLERQVAKGTIADGAPGDILARIATGTSLDALGGTDAVIEAATERPGLKFELFAAISEAAPGDALLATNTSSISITEIASNAAQR